MPPWSQIPPTCPAAFLPVGHDAGLPGPGTVFLQVEWRFLAPVRPGDEITGAVEVLEVRQDKPITRLRTTVSRQDGTVVLDGTAVCYTTPLTAG